MSLDLWFREDVARVLLSTLKAMNASFQAATSDRPAEAAAYKQGFNDALHAVGVAFGVATLEAGRSRRSVSDDSLAGAYHGWQPERRWSLVQAGRQRVDPDREERW